MDTTRAFSSKHLSDQRKTQEQSLLYPDCRHIFLSPHPVFKQRKKGREGAVQLFWQNSPWQINSTKSVCLASLLVFLTFLLPSSSPCTVTVIKERQLVLGLALINYLGPFCQNKHLLKRQCRAGNRISLCCSSTRDSADSPYLGSFSSAEKQPFKLQCHK